MDSRGILQGPVSSFVESTVKSDDGANSALDSVSVDGTTSHAQLSRNPKDGAFRRRRGSRWKANSYPAAKIGGTTEEIARYEARAYAMLYRQSCKGREVVPPHICLFAESVRTLGS